MPTVSLRLTPLEARDNPASTFAAFGAAPGGRPLVEVNRPDGTVLARFEALDSAFRGGVRASVGELDGTANTVEVVAAAGPGGGPRVDVFRVNLLTGQATRATSFFAFEPAFTGGVRVAVGNVSGAGISPTQQVIVGADAGGGPRVRVFQLDGSTARPTTGPLADFFAFEPTFTGGVRVASGELDGNLFNGEELAVAAGAGGGPRVRVLRSDGFLLADSFVFPVAFTGGVNVAATVTGVGALGQLTADDGPTDLSQRNVILNAQAGSDPLPRPSNIIPTVTLRILPGLFGNPGTLVPVNAIGVV